MKPKYKLMKVYEADDMPAHIHKKWNMFCDYYAISNKYEHYYIGASDTWDEDDDITEALQAIDKWLISTGAEKGESILIGEFD